MAATISPWSKPGAWALDSEAHEEELLQQQQQQQQQEDVADFPSLSAAAATKQPKKKKGQTLSLAEFTTYGGPKPPSRPSEPVGLTHEDRLILPTGPRERTAEELDRNRLGGGFRSYGSYDRPSRHSSGGGDDSSNSRWGSSRGSERSGGGGGFNRDANRDLGPSRADEVDNWATAKKPLMVGNGFERRDRDRGGFFDSQSKADESESWVANKSFTPSEGRRVGSSGGGGFDRERRGGGGFTSNSGGADSDFWGKKKEDNNGGGTVNEGGRPRLNLQPRTLPISNGTSLGSATAVVKPKGSNPFGVARPREEVLAEKGQDWKKIDEQLDSMKIKEVSEKAEDGGSLFGKRSFGIGNGPSGDRNEMSWRKPDTTEDAASSQSAEIDEDGPAEEK